MSQPIIDIGILTIREDEFRGVLKVFPDDHGKANAKRSAPAIRHDS